MASLRPRAHLLSAQDGLALQALEWPGGSARAPLLCLPGYVRQAADFAGVAARHGAGRRVVAVDYAGRGGSARAARPERYAAPAILRDVLDVCAALHLHEALVVGTSFGGVLALGLAVARPTLPLGYVLNDIGPAIEDGGRGFVRDFVARDPSLPDLDAAADYLSARLPHLSIADRAGWRDFAALTYVPGQDGRLHPHWDTRLAMLLDAPVPDLWPMFGATAPRPMLLLRGGRSDILSAATAARMAASHPDLTEVVLPMVGHAPTLAEPEAVAALTAFLDRAG